MSSDKAKVSIEIGGPLHSPADGGGTSSSGVVSGTGAGHDSVTQLKLQHFRRFVLILLAVQNASQILMMRFVRTRHSASDTFYFSTAVVLIEAVKHVASYLLILQENRFHSGDFIATLRRDVLHDRQGFLLMCVPSFVYVIQNNLMYYAVSHLDAATFQVLYQLKILTTAVMFRVMLKKPLSVKQWIALCILFSGVSLVQSQITAQTHSTAGRCNLEMPLLRNNPYPLNLISLNIFAASFCLISVSFLCSLSCHTHTGNVIKKDNPGAGFLAIIIACVLSGFAGVFFEKVLKSTTKSVWVRNLQLSTSGFFIALATMLFQDRARVAAHGFFHGYDVYVWLTILLHSLGGLVVAAVVKHADNILKGFATSAAIVLSAIVSIYTMRFAPSLFFCAGTALVILATYLYSYAPSAAPPTSHSTSSSSSCSVPHPTIVSVSSSSASIITPSFLSASNNASVK